MSRFLTILASLSTLFALFSRGQAHKAKTKQQEQRADIAEARADQLQHTAQARTEIQQKHQQETQDAKARIDAGDRNHLDNNW